MFIAHVSDGRRAVPGAGVPGASQQRLRRLPRLHRRGAAAREPVPVRTSPERRDRVPDDHVRRPVPHRLRDAAARRRSRRRHGHQSRRKGTRRHLAPAQEVSK